MPVGEVLHGALGLRCVECVHGHVDGAHRVVLLAESLRDVAGHAVDREVLLVVVVAKSKSGCVGFLCPRNHIVVDGPH